MPVYLKAQNFPEHALLSCLTYPHVNKFIPQPSNTN